MPCPVCRDPAIHFFAAVEGRDYWRCAHCEATFLHPQQLPDMASSAAHYRLHRNDPADPGYRAFLSRLSVPLSGRLCAGSEGLDYGCGPGPALAAMLEEAGQRMRIYDPLFFPDDSALKRSYDFITCSEVAEHFHQPAREFEQLDALLRPGGWLGVMTAFLEDDTDFSRWHYRRDPTHVVFYRPATFAVIARQRRWQCEIPAPHVVLLHKAPA